MRRLPQVIPDVRDLTPDEAAEIVKALDKDAKGRREKDRRNRLFNDWLRGMKPQNAYQIVRAVLLP